jgi:hypothetical protein
MGDKESGNDLGILDLISMCELISGSPYEPTDESIITFRGNDIIVRSYRDMNTGREWNTFCTIIHDFTEEDQKIIDKDDILCDGHHFCIVSGNPPEDEKFSKVFSYGDVSVDDGVDMVRMWINRFYGRRKSIEISKLRRPVRE